MKNLIPLTKSIIPACDVANKEEFEKIIIETCDIPGIGAYKVGLELTILFGLKILVEIARRHTDLPIIYDHQKGGTDIPDLGTKFAKSCAATGVDAVILFPFGGSVTEREWIKACQSEGLKTIVGGHMTQKNFLASEDGFIADNAPERIYEVAMESGIRDFVVPGNKQDLVVKYRRLFENEGINFSLYAPGFIAQGGSITDCGKVAGENWHAIVGTAIYKAQNMREAARILTSEII